MTNIKIANLSKTVKRSEWCNFVAPITDELKAATHGKTLNGFEVIPGRFIGSLGRMVHVKCKDLNPEHTFNDKIVWSSSEFDREHKTSKWVKDEPLKMVPKVVIGYTDDEGIPRRYSVRPKTKIDFKVISENPAEKIWEFRYRPTNHNDETCGFYVIARLYVYSDQEVVKFETRIGNSSTADPQLHRDYTFIRVDTGEYHFVDNSDVLGLQSVYNENEEVFSTFIDRHNKLADGVRFIVTGKILPSPKNVPINEIIFNSREKFNNGVAAVEGPLLGQSVDWRDSGKFLALGDTPLLPAKGAGFNEILEEWKEFKRSRTGGFLGLRKGGLSKRPGDAGDQGAFGASRGGRIAVGMNPLAIEMLIHSITSFLRPDGHYTEDIRLVTREEFPKLRLWTGRPHPLQEFTETLGKGDFVSPGHRPDTGGWVGEDEQHEGGLPEQAAYLLTGDLWLLDLINEQKENWLMAWNETAGRAIGRTWLARVNDYLLSSDDRVLTEIVKDFQAVKDYDKNITGPVKTYAKFKDPRALVDEKGKPVLCSNYWQTGLMCPGVYAAWLVTKDPEILDFLKKNLDSLARWGWFERDQRFSHEPKWMCADYVAFNNGGNPSRSWYRNNGNVVGKTHSTGWFTWWVAYATVLARKFAKDKALIEKLDSIIDTVLKPQTWRDSHWVS